MFFNSRLKMKRKSTSKDVVADFEQLADSCGVLAKSDQLLSAPKVEIKRSIITKLNSTSSSEVKQKLVDCFLKISHFQPLSSVEQERIKYFLMMLGAMWDKNANISEEEKNNLPFILGTDDVYGKVVDRIHKEKIALKAELIAAGFLSNRDVNAIAQDQADGANVMAKKLGITTTLTAQDFQSDQRVRNAQS